MPLYAITIFLGAFLLFQVQPIMGRYVLPWFGGGAGVWTTCMLFFQALLVGGYAYAHLLSSRLKPKAQLLTHAVLLLIAGLFLPLSPDAQAWRQDGELASPAAVILWRLLLHVGLPYFMLASTAPLLGAWFASQFPGRSPWRLYALSNLGSLLALLTYPVVVETQLSLSAQGVVWSTGFGLYALFCVACAWRRGAQRSEAVPAAAANAADAPHVDAAGAAAPTRRDMAMWLGLSCVGSVLLLATTSQMCQDLAVVPMLWIMPLAIYLVTFIICFDREHWYRRGIYAVAMAICALAVNAALHARMALPVLVQIAIFCTSLFVCCMVCHGELSRRKPSPAYLTRFYLVMAAGGALGGLLTAVLAPLLLPDFWEYHLGLLAACALGLTSMYELSLQHLSAGKRRAIAYAGATVCLALALSLAVQIAAKHVDYVHISRNFYGVVQIQEVETEIHGPSRAIVHGNIMHGQQLLKDAQRRWPTAYYGRFSGIGRAVAFARGAEQNEPQRKPLRIGVIGLGAGVLATHVEDRDSIRFYEIDPQVEGAARKYFTFLADCPGKAEVAIGDARVLLQRELDRDESQKFDVLAVDAFNSDSIPIHLITQQAFDLYVSHLRDPNAGIIAFHISNRFTNLLPVVRGLAKNRGFDAVLVADVGEPARLVTRRSEWVLVTKDRSLAQSPAMTYFGEGSTPDDAPTLPWTDDFASLWQVMSINGTRGLSRWLKAPNEGSYVVDLAGLIDVADEDRIHVMARRVYQETQGRNAIAVVTVEQRTGQVESGGGEVVNEYAAWIYNRMELSMPPGDRGILLFISTKDARALIRWGNGFNAADRAVGAQVLNEIVLPGLKAGRASSSLRTAVAALVGHVRRIDAQAQPKEPVRQP